MIAHLSGALQRKSTHSIIIDIGGIGYEVYIPLSTFYTLPELEEKVNLHIVTHVREDAFHLFGFRTMLEKDLFLLLISVSGIGPKLAVNILSGMGPEDLVDAMARGDGPRLQSIPGVGRKIAERIVLELREKAMKVGGEREPSPPHQIIPSQQKKIMEDATSALVNLGYPSRIAKGSVEKAHAVAKEANLEVLIKEALRILA